MKHLILVLMLGLFAFQVKSQNATPTATITFLGGNFQKDAKLDINFNGKSIGFMSKGLEMVFTTNQLGEVLITTQGYNMIDAMYGPPVQLKLTLEADKEYFLDAKWSKSNHLTIISKEEVAKATKGGKKIYSTIEVQ